MGFGNIARMSHVDCVSGNNSRPVSKLACLTLSPTLCHGRRLYGNIWETHFKLLLVKPREENDSLRHVKYNCH